MKLCDILPPWIGHKLQRKEASQEEVHTSVIIQAVLDLQPIHLTMVWNNKSIRKNALWPVKYLQPMQNIGLPQLRPRWLWSWCWAICLHLWPVAKCPVIMWSLCTIFSADFPRKSMGKPEGKVATCYHLVSGANWKSCLPKDFRFPLLHDGTENLGHKAPSE